MRKKVLGKRKNALRPIIKKLIKDNNNNKTVLVYCYTVTDQPTTACPCEKEEMCMTEVRRKTTCDWVEQGTISVNFEMVAKFETS